MKIIEAMKRVKMNKEKIGELGQRILRNSAHLSIETPLYGEEQSAKIKEWTQSALDTARDNVELLVRIGKTNQQTMVTIELAGVQVTKSIAAWVWRRREYSALDLTIWQSQNDRGLKEQNVQTSPGVVSEVKLVRYYDPATRDKNLDALRQESHMIDSALEIINAVTDLVEEVR